MGADFDAAPVHSYTNTMPGTVVLSVARVITENVLLAELLQDLHAFSDSLDLCKFSAFAEDADNYAEQYRIMTGIDSFTGDDVLTAGERIYNLERHFNNLNGFAGKEDSLPERFLKRTRVQNQ